MIPVNCYDPQGRRIIAYTQWDKNQEIVFEGQFNSPPLIHFCNDTMDSAISITPEIVSTEEDLYKVPVPNALLLVSHDIHMYFYEENGESGKSIYYKHIPVRPKTKPDDYEFEENVHVVSLVKLEKELRDLIASSTESENERKANEEIRQSNEENRVSQEQIRQENEKVRQDTLTECDNTLQEMNELMDEVTTSESERKANEEIRKSNESARQSAETERQENEIIRQQTLSQSRQAISDIRDLEQSVSTAESDRVAKEADRQSAEATRQENETIRQSVLSESREATADAIEATEKALDAAEKALGVAMGDISEKNVTFITAENANLLTSGDTLGVMMGQLNKWLVDLSDEITQEDIQALFQ